jgi:gas vesicle protein
MEESMSGSKFWDFLTGILVGGAVGYTVALLNAPRPGEETRQLLTEKSRDLRNKAVETVQTTVDKTGKLVDEGRERVGMTVEDTRNRVQERVTDLKDRGETVVTDARVQVSEKLHTFADSLDPTVPSTDAAPEGDAEI